MTEAKKKKSVKDSNHPKFGKLIEKTLETIKNNRKIIGGITFVYAIFYFLFSQGISAIDITSIRESLESDLGINSNSLGGRLVLASAVLESAGSLDDVGSTFMFFITLISSLALIWTLRQIWSNKKTTVKQSFYQGMYPIVPFIILTSLALIQLLPLIIGVLILSSAVQNDVFVGGLEIFGAVIVLLSLPAIWSLSMLITTLFAMIIVTIPNMKPMEAYRSAKDLIKGNKAYITRRIISWGLLLISVYTLMLLMIIAIAPILAAIVGILLTVVSLPLIVVYCYTLYRSLLHE